MKSENTQKADLKMANSQSEMSMVNEEQKHNADGTAESAGTNYSQKPKDLQP